MGIFARLYCCVAGLDCSGKVDFREKLVWTPKVKSAPAARRGPLVEYFSFPSFSSGESDGYLRSDRLRRITAIEMELEFASERNHCL